MQREQAHVGMLVVFGQPDGEQMIAKIVVVNPVRAKVETLEPRAGRPTGTRFNVPYHLMRAAEENEAPATRASVRQNQEPNNSG